MFTARNSKNTPMYSMLLKISTPRETTNAAFLPHKN